MWLDPSGFGRCSNENQKDDRLFWGVPRKKHTQIETRSPGNGGFPFGVLLNASQNWVHHLAKMDAVLRVNHSVAEQETVRGRCSMFVFYCVNCSIFCCSSESMYFQLLLCFRVLTETR